jgi:hypothetical protein
MQIVEYNPLFFASGIVVGMRNEQWAAHPSTQKCTKSQPVLITYLTVLLGV